MAQHSRPRPGISRMTRPRRIWYTSLPNRNREVHTERRDGLVGSPLLTAIDRMDAHMDEMLSTAAGSVPTPTPSAAPSSISAADTAFLQGLIKQEITHRLDQRIKDIVDKAITARLQQLKSAQKLDQANMDVLQTSYDYERRVLADLDTLHRHEHLLNSALVERLFAASEIEDDLAARFEETTLGLHGTDSVNLVLVSFVERLVGMVERLNKRVEELEKELGKRE